MQGKNPGIWIGAAAVLAVLIVALTIPRTRQPSPPNAASPGAPAQTGASRQAPQSATAPTPSPEPKAEVAGQSPSASPAIPSASVPVPAPVPVPMAPGRQAQIPAAPPQPEADSRPPASRSQGVAALDNLHFVLRDFRAALGGNPVGNNAEITQALLGANAKQLRADLPEGSRLSGAGELCDPWGTPYFFHQVSAQKMEVRSAGPDQQMWTGDDIQM